MLLTNGTTADKTQAGHLASSCAFANTRRRTSPQAPEVNEKPWTGLPQLRQNHEPVQWRQTRPSPNQPDPADLRRASADGDSHYRCLSLVMGFPGGTSAKGSACQGRIYKRSGFDPWVGKIPWSRKWQPTPALLPGKSHAQRSLGVGIVVVGAIVHRVAKKSDTTE